MKSIIYKKISHYKFLFLASIIFSNVFISFLFWKPGDLDCFLSSGVAAMNRDNPYTAYAIHYSSQAAPFYNLNPPASLLAFAPLSRFDLYDLHPFWMVASVLSLLTTLILLYREYKPNFFSILFIFAFCAFGETLALGQIYYFLLLEITIAWILLEKKHNIWAGIFIGALIVIKPNFMVWPILLFFNRNFKASISAFMAAILISAIPLFIWDSSIYVEWLNLASKDPYVSSPLNMSLVGIASRFNYYWLKLPIMIITIGLAVSWIIIKRPENNVLNGIALLTSILASPLATPTYALMLTPLFLCHPWSINKLIAAIIFTIPSGPIVFIARYYPSTSMSLGLIYSLGLIIILLDFVKDTLFLSKMPLTKSML